MHFYRKESRRDCRRLWLGPALLIGRVSVLLREHDGHHAGGFVGVCFRSLRISGSLRVEYVFLLPRTKSMLYRTITSIIVIGEVYAWRAIVTRKTSAEFCGALHAMRWCLQRSLVSVAPMRTPRALCGMTLVDSPFEGSDYFDVIMRVGRPIWRGARHRRTR